MEVPFDITCSVAATCRLFSPPPSFSSCRNRRFRRSRRTSSDGTFPWLPHFCMSATVDLLQRKTSIIRDTRPSATFGSSLNGKPWKWNDVCFHGSFRVISTCRSGAARFSKVRPWPVLQNEGGFQDFVLRILFLQRMPPADWLIRINSLCSESSQGIVDGQLFCRGVHPKRFPWR